LEGFDNTYGMTWQVNESLSFFGDASGRIPLFEVDPYIDNVRMLKPYSSHENV